MRNQLLVGRAGNRAPASGARAPYCAARNRGLRCCQRARLSALLPRPHPLPAEGPAPPARAPGRCAVLGTLALALRASAVPVSEHSASGCPGGLPGLAAPRTSSRRVSGRALRPSKTQHLRSGQVSWCTSRAAAPRGRGDPAADRTSAEPTVAAYHTQCRCCPSGRVTRREAGLHARWYGILSPFTFG